MPDYQWAVDKGRIISADYDRSMALGAEQVVNEIKKAFSNLFDGVTIESVNPDFKEVYKVVIPRMEQNELIYVCAKGTTPGGRSNLQNEQRIQQKAKYLNYAYDKKMEGSKAVCLGVYKHESDTIFCAWNINKSTAAPETPISKQIKITTIARALSEGFVQQMTGSGEYVCAFKSDFIYFYLLNSGWIHTDPVSQLNHHKDRQNFELNDNSDAELDNEVENEYQQAAKYLQAYASETGFDIPTKREDIKAVLTEFTKRFSPDILSALSDDELLDYLFYTVGENQDSLCCWLEMNTECRKHFGSISGGSAYKFGLFQKQKTGEWTTGSPQKPQVLTEDEALELGRNIRDALVMAAEIVQNSILDSITDYEQLDAELWEKVGEPYCNWGWFHKYLSMVCPDKFSSYHSSDWQRHILYALKIKPSEKYFARSGQLAMIENYANWYYSEFKDVLSERFGGEIIQFVRIATSDDEKNYAAEWNQKSVIGLGWRDIGSLDEYIAGESLNKGAIAEALKENYGYAENIASRKAGELIRFYKIDSSSVAVAMDGESLLAFVDDIGNYFFDATSPMANMKPGTWHRNFASGEQLPVKTEGKLTSCYPLTDVENLMFLYERYYYGSEEIIDEVDEIEFDNPEERNKRKFRAWMETQVKPEGDSDAGQPYTANSINQYVSNISNTPLPSNEEHSVFFTDVIVEVQDCLMMLETSEKKNNTQRSAVKKYLMYLMALQEVNMPLIYNTDLL